MTAAMCANISSDGMLIMRNILSLPEIKSKFHKRKKIHVKKYKGGP